MTVWKDQSSAAAWTCQSRWQTVAHCGLVKRKTWLTDKRVCTLGRWIHPPDGDHNRATTTHSVPSLHIHDVVAMLGAILLPFHPLSNVSRCLPESEAINTFDKCGAAVIRTSGDVRTCTDDTDDVYSRCKDDHGYCFFRHSVYDTFHSCPLEQHFGKNTVMTGDMTSQRTAR